MQVPEPCTAEHLELTGCEPKPPFLCLSYVHMAKHFKSKPGSPTEPVSTNIACVQDDASKPPMTEQELNKPFTLVLSIPHDKGLTAVFPRITIKTGVFPVDRENDAMHVFIVDKITDMTCDAMKAYFMMTSKIQHGIRCLVEGKYKHSATGKEYFRFLTSQCPSNYNVAITFATTCHQCLHSDSPPGRFIWVYLPKGFIDHLASARFIAIGIITVVVAATMVVARSCQSWL